MKKNKEIIGLKSDEVADFIKENEIAFVEKTVGTQLSSTELELPELIGKKDVIIRMKQKLNKFGVAYTEINLSAYVDGSWLKIMSWNRYAK
jgi:hypothetical protein